MEKNGLVLAKSFRGTFTLNTNLILILASYCLVAFIGCRSTPQPRPTIREITPGIKKVLVLPFRNMTQVFGENVSLRSPISGKVFVTGRVEPGADQLLTRLWLSDISAVETYELIPPEQAEGAMAVYYERDQKDQDERHQVTQIGKRLGADFVFIGHLYRFKERVGGKYAVDSPASVAFDVNMVGTSNGELVWSGHFDETQQSLNENLFLLGTFLKRRGTWVTAEEMATDGLNDLIQKMPVPELKP